MGFDPKNLRNRTKSASEGLAEKDKKREDSSSKENAQVSFVDLQKISSRAEDTRVLNIGHVMRLADSISRIGLIEPIVVDKKFRILAGGHRHKACQLLSPKTQKQILAELLSYNTDNKRDMNVRNRLEEFVAGIPKKHQIDFSQVPIRVYDFDALKNPQRALEIESSENTQRRDYTPTEVLRLYEKLKQSGYEDVSGRPKEGQRPLKPALALLMGTSIRTVQRHLKKTQKSEETRCLSEDEVKIQKGKRFLDLLNQVNAMISDDAHGLEDVVAKKQEELLQIAKSLEAFLEKLRCEEK